MRHRDPLIYTLLSFFIPFFLIYWLYAVSKDIERVYGFKAPSLWLIFAPFVSIFVAVIALIIGAATDGSGWAIGLGVFAIFVTFPLALLGYVYYYKFGGNVEKVGGPDTSRVLVFILLFFIAPAAVYIVQDKLNKLTPSSQQPQPPVQPQNPATF